MDTLLLDLDDFPKEILEHIISYMGNDEQLNMRLVNTKWFKLVNYRNFTLKFTTEKTLPHIVDRLLQYNGPIGLKFIKPRCKNLEIYAAQLARLTNLTSLKLPKTNNRNLSPEVWWSFTTLTNLREWQADGCPASVTASLINLRELMLDDLDTHAQQCVKNLSHLEVLYCQPMNYEPLDVFSLLPCPARLTSLMTSGNVNHTNASRLYNLRELVLFYHGNDAAPQLALDKFTALNNFSTDRLSFGALPTTLTSLAMESSALDSACHQYLTSLHNLKELSVDSLYINDKEYSWISHMTSLEHVSIWPSADDEGVTESYTGEIYNMIKSSKLVTLSTYVMVQVDLGHLSRLKSLESLFLWESALVHPDYSFASLLTKLTSFTVYATADRPSLTSLANLQNVKKLKVTGVRDHVAEIPMSLELLTQLECLIFDKCKAEVFQNFSTLTHLTCLQVKCLPDISYEFLKAMPLKDVKISVDAHDRFYTVLVQLTGLHSLKIDGLSGDQVIGLSALQHLTWLELKKSDVNKGNNLTHLTRLQSLYVTAPYVDSALLETRLPYLFNLRIET